MAKMDSKTSSKSRQTVANAIENVKQNRGPYVDHCDRHAAYQRKCQACNAVVEAWWSGYLEELATTGSQMPVNFACYGRQMYKGAGGGGSVGSPSPSHVQINGSASGDWSYKPGREFRERPGTGTYSPAALRPNEPLWNDWAKLSADDALAAKVYYSNLAHSDRVASRELLSDHEFVHKEQMLGILEDVVEDTSRNPYFLERGHTE
jgi:hypothetical protein